MGDFNLGHYLERTGVRTNFCVIQESFLTQHVLEPTGFYGNLWCGYLNGGVGRAEAARCGNGGKGTGELCR